MTTPAELAGFLEGLRAAPDGVVVPVHAQPGAHREGAVGLHGGALKVATREPADAGRATRRIGALLAGWLGVPPTRVSCVAGGSSRSKRFHVAGLGLETARARLAELLG